MDRIIMALMLLVAPVALADGTNITGNNPLDDVNITGGDDRPDVDTGGAVDYTAISVNGLEGEKLRNAINTTGASFDRGNYGNGREYKYDQAEKTADTGKGVAIATGAALMASGIPMSASIIPSVRAAGYALIAKAALEFAQAAADGSAARDNADREAFTRRPDNDIGSQSSGSAVPSIANSIASQINSPELQQLLTNRGVNSEAFINDIANGNLRDLQSVATAMGDTTSFTPSQITAAEAKASHPQGNGAKGTANLDVDEAEKLKTLGDGSEDKSPSGAGKESGQVAENQGGKGLAASGTTALASLVRDGVTGPGGRSPAGTFGGGAQSPAGGAPDSEGGIAGIFGAGGKISERIDMLSRFTRAQLEALGILKANNENIFQKAHRCFKSFNKWRRGTRLAAASE